MNIKLMKTLASLSKKKLQSILIKYLKGKGYTNIKATEMYIIAEGELPICLCAHMDTVFLNKPTEIYYDSKKTVMWSPQGLGADDRAGIFAILSLVERGYRPHIIFTDLEEQGAIGASFLIGKYPTCPFKECKALIQLDRRGSNDCVFYDCDNEEFTDLIQSYGFFLNWGTFSDIAIIAPAWSIAAVNLSVGYYREHSELETLNLTELYETIDKVENILKDCKDWKQYRYIPIEYKAGSKAWSLYGFCCCCGSPLVAPEPGQICEDCRGKSFKIKKKRKAKG